MDRLRTVDLSPIETPLSELHADLISKLQLLDPAPLRAILEEVRDALESLLRVTSLIDAATVRELDEAYATTVSRLRELSPRKLLIDAVDPVYVELLADILPAFQLVSELREFFESASTRLPDEIEVELGRVEVAFDRMLRAIPLDDASRSVTGSVSVGASASLS